MPDSQEKQLAQKEEKMIEHLDEMFEVTRNLSYDEDIKMYKKFKGSKILKKEIEKDERENEQQ